MQTSQSIDLEVRLRERLKGKVLLVGIGNTLRGDDGLGPRIIEALAGKVRAELLDVGEVPESYTGRIISARPDTIVLIDAADFGGAAGDLATLETEDFTGCAVSTHRMSLGVFCRYIKENSHADMFALGIQPAAVGFGETMTIAVTRSAQAVAEFLQRALALEG